MASDTPTRTLVDEHFARKFMPDEAVGEPGRERVHRYQTAPTYELSSRARFQDYFNRDLGCAEMSGGYGIFAPGARLPCHLHDFDESITIVQGTATCVVEGHSYSLSDLATALAPRGRCHYFINHSDRPMAMIWVYAGDLPQRLVLNEKCCLPGGCKAIP
jgi:quercetin dioxygenase-like cupin family protein